MKRFTLIQVLIVWLISTTSIMLNAQTWRKIQVFTHPEECQSYHPAEGPTCISNGIALIGSQYSSCDLNGQNFIEAAGAAYFHVLQPTGLWSQTQEIIASDRGYLDSFGYSVGIDFDCSIIGAPNKQKFDIATGSMINVGACYFFSKGSNGIWNQQQEIMASDAIADDNFGYSVFIMGDYAFIGDPGPLDNNVQFSHIGQYSGKFL